MNKTITLFSKTVSLFCLSVLLLPTQAHSQIVYTDVNPDVVLTLGNTHNIDLNGDATNNFLLGVLPINENVSGITVTGHSSSIFSLVAGSEFIGTVDPTLPIILVSKLAHQYMIDATRDYHTGTNDIDGGVLRGEAQAPPLVNTPTPLGNFGSAVNAFIGVKIEVGTDTLYGWIRVDVNADGTQMTIKDYAYQSTANTGIPAGQDANGNWVSVMENKLENSLSLLVTNESIQATEYSGKVVQAEIFNLEGKQLLNKTFSGSSQFGFDGLSAGIYIIRFTADNGVLTHKFSVQ